MINRRKLFQVLGVGSVATLLGVKSKPAITYVKVKTKPITTTRVVTLKKADITAEMAADKYVGEWVYVSSLSPKVHNKHGRQ